MQFNVNLGYRNNLSKLNSLLEVETEADLSLFPVTHSPSADFEDILDIEFIFGLVFSISFSFSFSFS